MHADRLERLAKLLDADADNPDGVKFDLGRWAAPSTPQIHYYGPSRSRDVWAEPQDNIPVSCGTTACALGLAAISGEFAAEGLSCHFIQSLAGGFTLVPACSGEFDSLDTGFDAGATLFDISYDDSRYLFDPDCYNGTPVGAQGERFVAQRIRDFIAGNVDEHLHPYHRGDDDSDA